MKSLPPAGPVAAPAAACDPLRPRVRDTYARAAAQASQSAVAPPRRRAACLPHSGLGCGSPTVFAGLAPGEWVLDLGSGAGFDCLAAAVEVGRQGRVIGVDMTPEMVHLARRHATDAGVAGVHFLQAEIEALPFPTACFDVVISNCVLNLCADKARVLAEACRVLKPGGRLAVADMVALAPLPAALQADLALHTGCIAGATPLAELETLLPDAGFGAVRVDIGEHSAPLVGWAPALALERFVAAASVTARKTA